MAVLRLLLYVTVLSLLLCDILGNHYRYCRTKKCNQILFDKCVRFLRWGV